MSASTRTLRPRPARRGDPSPDAAAKRRPPGAVPNGAPAPAPSGAVGGRAPAMSVAAQAAPHDDRAPGRRPAPVRRTLEVVPAGYRSARSRRNRRRLVTLAGVLVALAMVFGLVLVHVELTANEVRLTTLQTKAEIARVRNLKLRLEVSQLESPARIVATARELGMVPPPSITYLPGVPTGSNPAPAGAAGTGTQTGLAGWSVVKHADAGP